MVFAFRALANCNSLRADSMDGQCNDEEALLENLHLK
jgi:hypothetical protein